MKNSEETIEIINYLVSVGKNNNSFSESFPHIHHFHNSKSGDASLDGFHSHCKNHELEGKTNINIFKRLKIIKNKVNLYLDENESHKISSIKFHKFAKEAVDEIPFK